MKSNTASEPSDMKPYLVQQLEDC